MIYILSSSFIYVKFLKIIVYTANNADVTIQKI